MNLNSRNNIITNIYDKSSRRDVYHINTCYQIRTNNTQLLSYRGLFLQFF